MVKFCQTGLQKLNFEIIPKKRIFRFLPKISAGHGWSWKILFANFQILGPLGCQGWVVIPQIVKKSQNHCTLLYMEPQVWELSNQGVVYLSSNKPWIAEVTDYTRPEDGLVDQLPVHL